MYRPRPDDIRYSRSYTPTPMSTASSSSTTVNLSGFAMSLLGAAFIYSKVAGITEIAKLSWFWVLAPFWIGLAIFAAVMVIVGIIAAIVAAVQRR